MTVSLTLSVERDNLNTILIVYLHNTLCLVTLF